MRWMTLVVALAFAVGACSSGANETETPPEDLWKARAEEPYPFSGEVPPDEPTPVDGVYTRHAPVADVGAPVPCRRCPPYRIYAGTATLRMENGRYHVSQENSEWESLGHYRVDGAMIEFLNDPNCPALEVAYTWALDDGVLTFEIDQDPCAFDNLRGDYLTTYPWTDSGGG
jgi:hypothetical protein